MSEKVLKNPYIYSIRNAEPQEGVNRQHLLLSEKWVSSTNISEGLAQLLQNPLNQGRPAVQCSAEARELLREQANTSAQLLGTLPIGAPPQRPSWVARAWFICVALGAAIITLLRRLIRWMAARSWLWAQRVGATISSPAQLIGGTVMIPHVGLLGAPESTVEALSALESLLKKTDSPCANNLVTGTSALRALYEEWRTWPSILQTALDLAEEPMSAKAIAAFTAVKKMKERRIQRVKQALQNGQVGTLVGVRNDALEIYHFAKGNDNQIRINHISLANNEVFATSSSGRCIAERYLDTQLEAIEFRCSGSFYNFPLNGEFIFKNTDTPSVCAGAQNSPECKEVPIAFFTFVKESILQGQLDPEQSLEMDEATTKHFYASFNLHATAEIGRSIYFAQQLIPFVGLFGSPEHMDQLQQQMTCSLNGIKQLYKQGLGCVNIPPNEDWEASFLDLEQRLRTVCRSQPSAIALQPSHSSMRLETLATHIEVHRLEQQNLQQSAISPPDILLRLDTALSGLDSSNYHPQTARSICLAQLAGIESICNWHDEADLETLQLVSQKLDSLKLKLHPLLELSERTSVTREEWWTLQQLTALELQVNKQLFYKLMEQPLFQDFIHTTCNIGTADTERVKALIDQLKIQVESRADPIQIFEQLVQTCGLLSMFTFCTANNWLEQLQEQAPVIQQLAHLGQSLKSNYRALWTCSSHSSFELSSEQIDTINHWHHIAQEQPAWQSDSDEYKTYLLLLTLGAHSEIPKAPLIHRIKVSFGVCHWRWSLTSANYRNLRRNVSGWIKTKIQHLQGLPNSRVADVVNILPENPPLSLYPPPKSCSFNRLSAAAFACPYIGYGHSRSAKERWQAHFFRSKIASVASESWSAHGSVMVDDIAAISDQEVDQKIQEAAGSVEHVPFHTWMNHAAQLIKGRQETLPQHTLENLGSIMMHPVAARSVEISAAIQNQLVYGLDPLHDPLYLGQYVCATAASSLELSELQQQGLIRSLQELLRSALHKSRSPESAMRLIAWVARMARHLENSAALEVLEPLFEHADSDGDITHWQKIRMSQPHYSQPAHADFLRAVMWLDRPRKGLSFLEILCVDETPLLRAYLLEEGSTITALPLDGAEAEWVRDARDFYLKQWHPSMCLQDTEAIETSWAGQLLGVAPAELEIEEQDGLRSFRVRANESQQISVSALQGTRESSIPLLNPRRSQALPPRAFQLIPMLAKMVGQREIFDAWDDGLGNRRYRILNSDDEAQWIDYVENINGAGLEGHFKDPLKQGAAEAWSWHKPHQNGSYPLLDLWGCWTAGTKARLIATANPLSASLLDCFSAKISAEHPTVLQHLSKGGSKLYLLPRPSTKNILGLEPLHLLYASHQNAQMEGTFKGEARRIVFPSLDNLECRYAAAPAWAPSGTPGMCWHIHHNEQHYIVSPTVAHAASTILGSHFVGRSLALYDASGRAHLWFIPEPDSDVTIGTIKPITPLRLQLSCCDPTLVSVQPMDLDHLVTLLTHINHNPLYLSAVLYLSLQLKTTAQCPRSKNAAIDLYNKIEKALIPKSPPLAVLLVRCLAWASRHGIFDIASGRLWALLRDGAAPSAPARHAIPDPDDLQVIHCALQANPIMLSIVCQRFPQLSAFAAADPALPHEGNRVLDYIHQIHPNLALPIAATPEVPSGTVSLPDIGSAGYQPPLDEDVSVWANRVQLAAIYPADSIYSDNLQSCEAAAAFSAPNRPTVTWSRSDIRAWQRMHQQSEDLATQLRSWMVSQLVRSNSVGSDSVRIGLIFGNHAEAPQALREVLEQWCQGKLDVEWANCARRLAECLCTKRVLEQLLQAGRSTDQEQRDLALLLLDELRSSLAEPESNASPEELCIYRQRLVMQATRGIIIRNDQIQAVKQMLAPEGATLQLRPGFGKTDVVVPLLLKVGQNLAQTWTVIVPKHLIGMARQGLSKSPETHVFECDRKDLESSNHIADLEYWCQKLEDARRQGIPVVTTGETLAALEVAIAEKLSKNEDSGALLCRRMRELLRQGRHIVDEVDAVCAPNRKLVFAEGEPQQAAPVYNRWIRIFFEKLLTMNQAEVAVLREHLDHKTTATLLLNQAETIEQAIRAVATKTIQALAPDLNIDALLSRDGIDDDAWLSMSDPQRAFVLFVRQMVYRSIPQLLSRAYGGEYGWSRIRGVGVPFADGEEEANTQFSIFSDQLAFTMASAYFSIPIDQDMLHRHWIDYLERLKRSGDDGDLYAQQLTDLRVRAEQANLAATAPGSVVEIMQSMVEEPQYRCLRLRLAETVFATNIHTYSKSIQRRMADIVSGLEGVVGITGTLRQEQLPAVFADSEQHDRRSSLEVHAALLRSDTRDPLVLDPIHDQAEALNELCKLAIDHDVILNQVGLGHDHAGSRRVALAISRYLKGTPVVFYDPDTGNRILEWRESMVIERALEGSAPADCKFYYGPHDLRGVNFIIPDTAEAIYLPSPTVLDDSLEQAVRRLRKLSRHQKVHLCLTHGIAESLTDDPELSLTQRFILNVLRRTLKEEQRLQAQKESNESLSTHHHEQNMRWLTGNPYEKDFEDVIHDIPLVDELWRKAIAADIQHGTVETQVALAQQQQQEQEQRFAPQYFNIERIRLHHEDRAPLISTDYSSFSWDLLGCVGQQPTRTTITRGELVFSGNALEQRTYMKQHPESRRIMTLMSTQPNNSVLPEVISVE